MSEEVYYKVFNGQNQLLLVTPLKKSVIDLLEESTQTKIDTSRFNCHTKGSRFYEGFRIENLKL
jgi:hypothetical protein